MTMGAREALSGVLDSLGLSDAERDEVERRITPEDLHGVANSRELHQLVVAKAWPFWRMKERRKQLQGHECPGGRHPAYYGNGRCGRCDGYHGLLRRRSGW